MLNFLAPLVEKIKLKGDKAPTMNVIMWPHDPNWQMTARFLIAVAETVLAMKFVAMLLPANRQANRSRIFWVLVSPTSFKRLQPITSIHRVLFRTAFMCGTLVLSYWVYWQLVQSLHLRGIILSYCAAPILMLATETVMLLVGLFWLPSGWALPRLHNRPWLMHSVADFWGNRWNLWFSDWTRYVIFQRLRHRPVLALVVVFAFSGLMHEGIINASLYLVTGGLLFGTMMLYFLLQAGGILVERWFKKRSGPAITFAWLVVFVPAPLIINEGLLRTLQLWPEPVRIIQDDANSQPGATLQKQFDMLFQK